MITEHMNLHYNGFTGARGKGVYFKIKNINDPHFFHFLSGNRFA